MRKKELINGSLWKRGGIWYWNCYDQFSKRRVLRSTKQTDRKGALKIARQWALDYHRQTTTGSPSRSVDVQFGQAFADYIMSIRRRVSPRWLIEIGFYYDVHLQPYFGSDFLLRDFRPRIISEFRDSLIDGKGLKPNTVNKILSTLSQILKFSCVNEWIEQVPFIQRIPEAREEFGYELKEDEIRKLLAGLVDAPYHLRPFVILCLFCGLRHSEALRIKWSDIDFGKGTISLIQKNKSSMKAPLGSAGRMLQKIPIEDRGIYVVEWEEPDGRRRPVRTVRHAWNKFRERIGMPQLRIHDLRHTFVSRMFRLLGYDARILSRHKSMTAFVTYLHSNNEDVLRRANEAFSGF